MNVDLRYVRDFSEVSLKNTDAVLVVGKPKDLRAFQVESLENVLKQVEVPRQVIYLYGLV